MDVGVKYRLPCCFPTVHADNESLRLKFLLEYVLDLPDKIANPSDPMHSEGPQSYVPHWARPHTTSNQQPPSVMQSEERGRLVAEIKKHHPGATTEQILAELEAWGE